MHRAKRDDHIAHDLEAYSLVACAISMAISLAVLAIIFTRIWFS